MRKFISILLAVLLLTLTACTSSNASTTGQPTEEETTVSSIHSANEYNVSADEYLMRLTDAFAQNNTNFKAKIDTDAIKTINIFIYDDNDVYAIIRFLDAEATVMTGDPNTELIASGIICAFTTTNSAYTEAIMSSVIEASNNSISTQEVSKIVANIQNEKYMEVGDLNYLWGKVESYKCLVLGFDVVSTMQ